MPEPGPVAPPAGAAVHRYTTWAPARLPAAIGIIALLLEALPGAGELLEFDRERILAGEFWRTLTGQVVHWSESHLLWNVVGAGLLAIGFRELPARFWAIAGSAAALGIATGLLLETPPLDEYRGLSGVLYGWLVAALLARSAAHEPGRIADGRHASGARVARRCMAGAVALWALADALGLAGALRASSGTPHPHGAAHVYGMLGACLASWTLYRPGPVNSGRNPAGCD